MVSISSITFKLPFFKALAFFHLPNNVTYLLVNIFTNTLYIYVDIKI